MSRFGTRRCPWLDVCIVGAIWVLSSSTNLALYLAKSQASQLQFEVASIKPSTFVTLGDNNPESIDIAPSGRLTMRNIRLSSCLKWAFDVQDSQVSGPGWIESERYDIIAQATGPTTTNNLKLMLRSLLADRIKLELHHAKKEASVYGLVVAKKRPEVFRIERRRQKRHSPYAGRRDCREDIHGGICRPVVGPARDSRCRHDRAEGPVRSCFRLAALCCEPDRTSIDIESHCGNNGRAARPHTAIRENCGRHARYRSH